MKFFSIFLLFIQFRSVLSATAQVCEGDSDVPTEMLNLMLKGYDKNMIPSANGVDVYMEIAIQSFADISEISSSFSADVLFGEIWLDKRLQFETMAPCVANLTLGYRMVESVFLPNVCFVNSKHTSIHQSPTPNVFLLIFPNGTVWVNYRVRVMGPCKMDLTSFPMDEMSCELIFESYSFNTAKVRLFWKQFEPVLILGETQLPDFSLYDHKWDKKSFEYPAGKWDQLSVTFFFKRSYGFYVMQMYLPTYAMVLISWVSFWLDAKSLPARVSLSVSTLISLTLLYGNVARNLPKVSYVKGIDVWMFSCVGFIVLSLVELAIVDFVEKINQERRKAESDMVVAAMEMKFTSDRVSDTPKSSLRAEPTVIQRSVQLNRLDWDQKSMSTQSLLSLAENNISTATVDHSARWKVGQTAVVRPKPVWKEKFWSPLKLLGDIFTHKGRLDGAAVDRMSRWLFPSVFFLLNVIYWWYFTATQGTMSSRVDKQA